MAESERDRVGYFRQRWAHENFDSNSDVTSHPQQLRRNDGGDELGPIADLTAVYAEPPAGSDSRVNRWQKRAWRENLRSPFGRLAPVGAPLPTSNASTSIRSPVDSHNNTIYSDTRDQEEGDQASSSRAAERSSSSNETPAWLIEIYTLSWLIFFSLLGTLARLGVEAITQYPDAPVSSRVLWANLGGSFVMGFLIEDRNLFGLPVHLQTESKEDEGLDEKKLSATHLKHKKSIPLYVGLTTGFCGSFTSFSSFIRDAFLALTNALVSSNPMTPYHPATSPSPRNGGFSILALLAILIIHPSVSLAASKVGAHFALLLRPIMPRQVLPTRLTTKIINPLFVLIGAGSWLIGALFLTIFPPSSGPSPVEWRARATIPLLFAPLGCILRYYLAKYLNRPSTPNFPWGTFVANIFGTLVLGMAWDLQHARTIGAAPGGGNACAILLGVQEGFCGCLTTVSTWVVELSGLSRKWAWIYGLASVIVGLAGLVIEMGSMGWTIGFAEPVCG